MKIYVASKWEEHDTVKKIMIELEAAGHVITCDWTDHKYPQTDIQKELSRYAIDDINGVRNADIVIVYALNTTYTYRGAIGEMTAAIALGKPVYLIGHSVDECIFSNHPLVRRASSINEILKQYENHQK